MSHVSQHNILKLSCGCGAQVVFEEAITSEYSSDTKIHRVRDEFLRAHEVCRTKANDSQVVKRMLEAAND